MSKTKSQSSERQAAVDLLRTLLAENNLQLEIQPAQLSVRQIDGGGLIIEQPKGKIAVSYISTKK